MKKTSAYIFGPAIFDNNNNAVEISAIITELDVIENIKMGKRRGLSPEIKIKWFQCTLCGQNYELCSHEEGKYYEGRECILAPRDIEFLGQSIVDTPKDPRATITDMLIIEEENNIKKYYWYGYKILNSNNRFKNIQQVFNQKRIPEKVAVFFAEYFSVNSEGIISYSPSTVS